MNSSLKGLSLNLLLRNFFAGVFFLFSIHRAGLVPTDELSYAETLTVGTLVALVAGTMIYAIHRTILNPWIEIFRYSNLCQRFQEGTIFKCGFLSQAAVNTLVDRWDNTLFQDQDSDSDENEKRCVKPARYRGLSAWSDYIHLFYCSGLALIVGGLVSIFFSKYPCSLKIDWHQCSLAVIFLGFGLLSDIRRQYVEDRCIERPPSLDENPRITKDTED